jgi:hypothetical protein
MSTKLTTAHESAGASTTAMIVGSMPPPADLPAAGAGFSADLSGAESDMGEENLNLSA